MECDDLAGNMRRLLVAVCGAAWLATGCATPGPSAATQGATLAHGARAVGWISGDAARDLRRRAVIGAGTSALAPGAVGYYMDVQEAALHQALEGAGVSVVRVGNDITLVLPAGRAFAADDAQINPAFVAALDAADVVLRKYDKTVIEVAGHTDNAATHERNQSLSERWAAAVAGYLETHGVRPLRLVTIGSAEARPVATNATAQGRASNRRVELTLSPLTQGT